MESQEAKSNLKDGGGAVFGNSGGDGDWTSAKRDVDGGAVPGEDVEGFFYQLQLRSAAVLEGTGTGKNEEPNKTVAEVPKESLQSLAEGDNKINKIGMLEQWRKDLLKEEKTLKNEVEGLNKSIDEAVEGIQMKQDEIGGLIKILEKLEKGKKNGVEPPRANEADGKNAILMLPEEMWTMIFAQLTDPKDLWNCSNTCGLFQQILEDWKKPTWDFMQVFPLLFQYLPQNQILKCRSVSKGWNMAVDQHMESHPLLRPRDKDEYDPRLLPFVTPMKEKSFYRLNKFDFSRGGLQSERNRFPQLPDRNPFLGRAVTLVIGGSRDTFQYWLDRLAREEKSKLLWERVYSFLGAFGRDIWYLTVKWREEKFGSAVAVNSENHVKLRQLLTVDLAALAPNLRKLRILPNDLVTPSLLIYGNPSDIVGTPVATFPNLETVVASSPHVNCRNLPVVLLLQKHSATLKEIHLTGELWKGLHQLEWPNLRQLHLDHLTNELELNMLLDAGARMPQLIKLGMNLRGNMSCDRLLDVIHRFFATTRLSNLRLLGGIAPEMFEKTRWKCCNSPTLKTLEVEHDHEDDAGFYNFLLHFPLVENVHVFLRRGQRKEDDDDDSDSSEEDGDKEELVEVAVQQYLRDGKMYHSNVWEKMPRLKMFTYRWDVYTRMGYDQFMEQQRRKLENGANDADQ